MDLDAQAALLYERVAAVADATTADRVVGSARPGVTFRRSAPCTDDGPLGASKLGGDPDLPPHLPWPQYADEANIRLMTSGPERGGLGTSPRRPLAFVTQIDLADVTHWDTLGLLPKAGLLSCFHVDDNMEVFGLDARDATGWRLFYSPPEAELLRRHDWGGHTGPRHWFNGVLEELPYRCATLDAEPTLSLAPEYTFFEHEAFRSAFQTPLGDVLNNWHVQQSGWEPERPPAIRLLGHPIPWQQSDPRRTCAQVQPSSVQAPDAHLDRWTHVLGISTQDDLFMTFAGDGTCNFLLPDFQPRPERELSDVLLRRVWAATGR